MTGDIIKKWAAAFPHGLFPWRAMLASELYGTGYTKAMETKWHDLRKNPKDLPPMYERCIFIRPNTYKNGAPLVNESSLEFLVGCYSYFNDEELYGTATPCFYDENADWEFPMNEVIAWCELPKFEVEQ